MPAAEGVEHIKFTCRRSSLQVGKTSTAIVLISEDTGDLNPFTIK